MTKAIVITGSTRGIGFGLAEAFLNLGCHVVVCGRTEARTQATVDLLGGRFGVNAVHGHPCDVTDLDQVQALWDAAVVRYGRVDIWINNAGISHNQASLWEMDRETIDAVTATNLTGTLYGCKVALAGMVGRGGGAIYNMEGLGSAGPVVGGLAVYAASKSAVRTLTKARAKQVEGTPVLVGALSPGMVITDLLMRDRERDPAAFERAKRIYRILADRVETVTPWLARRALDNEKNGATIAWLTTPKSSWRFLTAALSRRDPFADQS
jgi:NAD(P)-dependent dehydrogenase (short-subunit alcohol dehydrogenase family)